MNKQKSSDKFNPIVVFYWLIILAGLGIPLIIYIFTYSPVLTSNLATELAYARFLVENNSHISADGWLSTSGFFPLSLNFFLTFFVSSQEWKEALYNSSICCYVVYAICFILFSASLRARKIVTYIICAVLALVAGYYGLFALCDGSMFISYISALLLLAGLIINCFRIRTSPKGRYICYAASAFIILSAVILTCAIARTNNRKIASTDSIKNIFSYPLFKSEQLVDKEPSVTGLATYLSNKNILTAYATEDISNILSVVTEGKVSTAYVDSHALASPIEVLNCRQSTYEELNQNTGTVYLITSTTTSGPFDDYLLCAKKEYSDANYSLYSFINRNLLTDETVHKDMLDIYTGDYDTYILSMTDISNAELSELYRTKNWKAYTPEHIFSDLSSFDNYSAAVLDQSPNRVVLCIDPYSLYESVGFDSFEYQTLLIEKYESIIKNNPEVTFPCIFQSYHISHYLGYSESDFSNMYQAYKGLVDIFEPYSNVTYNYYGYIKYIYDNPHIYESSSDWQLNPDIATTLLIETLSDESHRMNTSGVLSFVSDLIDIAKDYTYSEIENYDLSDTTIVILGDSIFGNFSDNSSIQRVIATYSGANVFCRAVGGASATSSEKIGYRLEDQFVISEIQSDIDSVPSSNRLVFIIEFGLNDYFEGYPISDRRTPNSTNNFCGALRTTITQIKENWPASEIILLAPGYINYYSYGEEPMVEGGRPLSEYRDAVIALAKEQKCQCINLADIGITPETCGRYLYNDFVHYNGNGRYYIGKYLLDYLSNKDLQ